MIENITKRGYQTLTAIQMQAIPVMLHVSACNVSKTIYYYGRNLNQCLQTADHGLQTADCRL